MTSVLRKDPQGLHNVLRAQRFDLLRRIRKAKEAGDEPALDALRASLRKVKAALQQNDVRLALLKAAEAAEEAKMAQSADEQVEGVDMEDGPEMSSEPVPDGPDDESDEVENPVAMSAALRREVGDLAADYLDEYALDIHERVIANFESLNEALTLGEEDGKDGRTTLVEILRREIGNRGLARLRPHFGEWRESMVKKLTKKLNEMFAEPEPIEDPEPYLPEEPPPVVETEAEEEAPPDEPVTDEEAAADEEPEQPAPASAAADVPLAAPLTAGRLSFTTRSRGFKPSGAGALKLD